MITQAQKEANKRYRSKTFQKTIQYRPNEIEEYQKIEEHCKNFNTTYQKYVKELIRQDMERWEKGDSTNESTKQ